MASKRFCKICERHHRGRCELRATDSQIGRIGELQAEVNQRDYNDAVWQDGIYSRAEVEWSELLSAPDGAEQPGEWRMTDDNATSITHYDCICPLTHKLARHVWTDHHKRGSLNSCEHCCADVRTVGDMLHQLNDRRQYEEENKS